MIVQERFAFALDAEFDAFVRAATQTEDRPEGFGPFEWQRDLALRVSHEQHERADWPDICALPTASGKGLLPLIALFALAHNQHAPRRIAYVVDRRIVVDQAHERMEALRKRLAVVDPALKPPAEALAREPVLAPFAARLRERLNRDERPRDRAAPVRRRAQLAPTPLLETHLLRGGLGEPLARVTSPLAPTILFSTVDQLGSRLLFRGYGISRRARPIAAGLLAFDTLWLLDEAHLSRAFCDTLAAVRKDAERHDLLPRPARVVEVSATPRVWPGADVFRLEAPCAALRPRLEASKPVTIVEALKKAMGAKIARLVADALEQGRRRIGVIVNRVALARDVFDHVDRVTRKRSAPVDLLLLIGPIRPHDRERLYRWPEARALMADAKPHPSPIVAVATQTIEVGADLDFDFLIVQEAPLDVIRQRFGRRDRLGRLSESAGITVPPTDRDGTPKPGSDAGVIVAELPPTDRDGKPKLSEDPVYGPATRRALQWLRTIARNGVIDLGISALDARVEQLTEEVRAELCAPACQGEPLDRRHVLNLARTWDGCTDEPEVAIFLHGSPASGEVMIVWREDLAVEKEGEWADRVAAAPPTGGECLTIPVYAAQAFLSQRNADTADIAMIPDWAQDAGEPMRRSRRALRWDRDAAVEDLEAVDAQGIHPGDTLVVPSEYGGADEFGWAPKQRRSTAVVDVAEAAYTRRVRDEQAPDFDELLRARLRVTLSDVPPEEATAADEDAALEACAREALERLARDETVDRQRRRIAEEMRALDFVVTRARVDAKTAWVTYRRPRERDESDAVDPDDTSFAARLTRLTEHLRHVGERAGDFARACGLPEALARTVERAGHLHDLGKIDQRFQLMLSNGDVIAMLTGEPLAKGLRRRKKEGIDVPRRDRLPRGWRHEAVSAAMARGVHTEDPLLHHLIGTHHGYGRPGFPLCTDHDPRELCLEVDGRAYRASSDYWPPADGWIEQFFGLIDRYGAWGLAYLEAILRLADHRCSDDEEQGRYDD